MLHAGWEKGSGRPWPTSPSKGAQATPRPQSPPASRARRLRTCSRQYAERALLGDEEALEARAGAHVDAVAKVSKTTSSSDSSMSSTISSARTNGTPFWTSSLETGEQGIEGTHRGQVEVLSTSSRAAALIYRAADAAVVVASAHQSYQPAARSAAQGLLEHRVR